MIHEIIVRISKPSIDSCEVADRIYNSGLTDALLENIDESYSIYIMFETQCFSKSLVDIINKIESAGIGADIIGITEDISSNSFSSYCDLKKYTLAVDNELPLAYLYLPNYKEKSCKKTIVLKDRIEELKDCKVSIMVDLDENNEVFGIEII